LFPHRFSTLKEEMMDRAYFVENTGLLIEELTGLTRMSGRILAWLMTSDPPEQTMMALTEALHTSKSAISTSTRQLMHAGLIERKSIPGQRRDVYRLRPNAWMHLFLLESEKYGRFHELAGQGLALMADESEEQKTAMQEMYDLSGYLAEEVPRLIEQWRSGGSRSGGKRGMRSHKGSGPHAWEL
jgi:DNA-binding transcriptional regulator GbsR (MarR family)